MRWSVTRGPFLCQTLFTNILLKGHPSPAEGEIFLPSHLLMENDPSLRTDCPSGLAIDLRYVPALWQSGCAIRFERLQTHCASVPNGSSISNKKVDRLRTIHSYR